MTRATFAVQVTKAKKAVQAAKAKAVDAILAFEKARENARQLKRQYKEARKIAKRAKRLALQTEELAEQRERALAKAQKKLGKASKAASNAKGGKAPSGKLRTDSQVSARNRSPRAVQPAFKPTTEPSAGAGISALSVAP